MFTHFLNFFVDWRSRPDLKSFRASSRIETQEPERKGGGKRERREGGEREREGEEGRDREGGREEHFILK